MEFSIDVHTGLNGKIIIEDYSREYDQYFSEDETNQEKGKYKYSESKTINVLTKVNSESESKIGDPIIHNHDQLKPDPLYPDNYIYDLEKIKFTIDDDGYYLMHHIILPTKQWLENTYLTHENEDYRKSYESIYIIDDNNDIFKVIIENNFPEIPNDDITPDSTPDSNIPSVKNYIQIKYNLEPVSIEELYKRNIEGTTIEKCTIDIFYTGYLQHCYINYCNKLFSKLTKNCNDLCIREDHKELIYIRDFLWMVLNIIDYQISFKNYMEAQRLLEITNYCGNFCQNKESYVGSNTGCRCS